MIFSTRGLVSNILFGVFFCLWKVGLDDVVVPDAPIMCIGN